MSTAKDCGCNRTDIGFFDEIRIRMEEFITTIPTEQRVPEAVYLERLGQCSACDGLFMGTTCRYCGCITGMRAMRSNKKCPHPGGDRWPVVDYGAILEETGI